MLSFIVLLLLFIIPGFIAAFIFEFLCGSRVLTCYRSAFTALIFDLLIVIVNFLGLIFFKHICDIRDLTCDFNCMKFASKYGLLSILVGIVLAIIFGVICRLYHHIKERKGKR
jgi:hypothetical protein